MTTGKVHYVNPFDVTIIGFDTPHQEGDHPLWDERIHLPVDPRLVRNISVYGVSTAVKVRRNGKNPEGADILEVIDGRQRVRACREVFHAAESAGEVLTLLKIEYEKSDDLTHVGLMISLNEQRQGDTPIARARKAFRATQLGHSQSDVAVMFGVTKQCVDQWLKLVDLDTEVQTAVDSGEISATAALGFSGLSRQKQREGLATLREDSGEDAQRPTKEDVAAVTGGARVSRPRVRKLLTLPVLRKLAEEEEWVGGLSSDAQALFRVLLGDESAIAEVPGLSELLG